MFNWIASYSLIKFGSMFVIQKSNCFFATFLNSLLIFIFKLQILKYFCFCYCSYTNVYNTNEAVLTAKKTNFADSSFDSMNGDSYRKHDIYDRIHNFKIFVYIGRIHPKRLFSSLFQICSWPIRTQWK